MKISNTTTKYYFALAFIMALVSNAITSLSSNINSWGLTEWLINYSGGFVRRGLPGELIGLSSFDPRNVAVIISFLSLAFLLVYIYSQAKGTFPFYIVISPLFMGFPYFGGILRKDVFLLCLLAILLKIIKRKSNLPLVWGIITVGMLSHEMFFFISIPIIFAFLYLKKSDYLQYGFYVAYPIILMFFLIVNKGDASVASSINHSWFDSFVKYCGSCDNSLPSAAIDAIGWSSEKGLSLSLSVLNKPLVILGWIIIIILCILISLGKLESVEQKPQWLLVLLFQLIAISPLFVVGWDFGRWISIWMTSSILIYLSLRDYLPSFSFLQLRISIPNLNLTLVLLSIPGCCLGITALIKSHPILGRVYDIFFPQILEYKYILKTLLVDFGIM